MYKSDPTTTESNQFCYVLKTITILNCIKHNFIVTLDFLKMSNIFYYSNAEQRNQRVKQVNTQHVKQTDNGNNLVSSSSPIMNVEKGILDTDVKVKFGEIKDPTEFFLVNQYRIQEYQVLKSHLANFYDLPENRQWQPIDPNQYYVFKYLTTGVWFRVQILCQMDDYCKCWWIDEGVTLDIHQSFLFPLDPGFYHFSPLSFKASLYGIDVKKHIPIHIINRFKLKVLRKIFTAKVVANHPSDTYPCLLYNEESCLNDETLILLSDY